MNFSIIIPFYNLERYVTECLDSVVAQTFGDYEAICVDDGSSDGTPKLLDGYARRDARIKVIHKQNGGEGSARNAGLGTAHGDWICYLDGDDVWSPTFLADIAAGIATNPNADMVSVRQWNFNDGESIAPPSHADGLTTYDASKTLSSDLFMIGVWSTAYRRSIYGDVRFTTHCIGADRVYTMKCLSRSNTAIVCAAQDYGYRLRGSSMAHGKMNAKKLNDGMDAARLCVEILAKSGKQMDMALRRRMASAWLEQYPAYILRHDNKNEQSHLLSTWLTNVRSADAAVLAFLPPWYGFTVPIFKSGILLRLFMYVLCSVPTCLKAKGIHR